MTKEMLTEQENEILRMQSITEGKKQDYDNYFSKLQKMIGALEWSREYYNSNKEDLEAFEKYKKENKKEKKV